MAELKLNIVFDNLNKLKQKLENISIGGGGGTKSGGGANATAKNTGKMAFLLGGIFGFIAGIFTSLQSVTGIISIVGGLLNQLVTPFVPFLLTVLKPVTILLGFLAGYMLAYYKDPFKVLLRLGLFIVNGILTGLEFLINTVRNVFGLPSIELGRFQENLVMQAYDNFKEDISKAAEDGKVTFKETFDAITRFGTGVKNSFLTNSEYIKLVDEGLERGLDESSIMGAILEVGAKDTGKLFDRAFDNMQSTATTMNERAIDLGKQFGAKVDTRNIKIDTTRMSELPAATRFRDLITGVKRQGPQQINITNNIAGSVNDQSTIDRMSTTISKNIFTELIRKGIR